MQSTLDFNNYLVFQIINENEFINNSNVIIHFTNCPNYCFSSIISYLLIINISTTTASNNVDNVSIALWNLENFGPIKTDNETLLNFYVNKLDDNDLFLIQEIRDSTTDSIESLTAKLPNYNYLISKPAGQGISKEQCANFYNNELVLLSTTDWTEKEQNNFERPPLEASFKVKNWTLTLYTIHIKLNNIHKSSTISKT